MYVHMYGEDQVAVRCLPQSPLVHGAMVSHSVILAGPASHIALQVPYLCLLDIEITDACIPVSVWVLGI